MPQSKAGAADADLKTCTCPESPRLQLMSTTEPSYQHVLSPWSWLMFFIPSISRLALPAPFRSFPSVYSRLPSIKPLPGFFCFVSFIWLFGCLFFLVLFFYVFVWAYWCACSCVGVHVCAHACIDQKTILGFTGSLLDLALTN